MADDPILDLLPEVISTTARPGSPLAALAAAATDLHAPVVDVLDRLDSMIDPFRAPGAMVAYLAWWVDLGWLDAPVAGEQPGNVPGIGVDRLRDLVAASAELSARRGTPGGLARFLRVATGVDGFVVDDVPGAFRVVVRVPPAAADRVELVRRLVVALRPAHVTSEVVLGDDAAQVAAPTAAALPQVEPTEPTPAPATPPASPPAPAPPSPPPPAPPSPPARPPAAAAPAPAPAPAPGPSAADRDQTTVLDPAELAAYAAGREQPEPPEPPEPAKPPERPTVVRRSVFHPEDDA